MKIQYKTKQTLLYTILSPIFSRRRMKMLLSIGMAGLSIHSSNATAIYSEDLNSGDKFHLVFVTAGTRDATSSDINDYNTFAQSEAALAGLDTIFSQTVTWKVIGSTPGVNARDNIGDPISPIYNMIGEKVADNETGLWDGAIDNDIPYDQYSISALSSGVRTGTSSDGSATSTRSLGDHDSILGSSYGTGPNWIYAAYTGEASPYSFYAISDEITYTSGDQMQSVDADDFSDGQNMSSLTPGVTLSVENGSLYGGDVFAAESAYSSTGTRTFAAQLLADNSIQPDYWNGGFSDLPILRADFDEATNLVLIDFITDDANGDVAKFEAYDSEGNLLETYMTDGASALGEVDTAIISRDTADIAYILAYGDGGATLAIDNLRFHAVPEPSSLALLSLGGLGLLRRRRGRVS